MRISPSKRFTSLPFRIALTLIGTGLTAISVLIFVAFWMSNVTNDVARENSSRLVSGLLQAKLEALSVNVEDYGYWEDAYEMVKARDAEALVSNVGVGAIDNPTFDFLYILSPSGHPLYGYEDGGEGSDLSVVDERAIAPFLADLKSRPVLPYPTVNAYARVNGRVAMVSAGRILPYDEARQIESELPILVGGYYLEGGVLPALADQLLLEDISIAPVLAEVKPELNAQDIISKTGKRLGVMTWLPPRPGDELMSRSWPIIIALSTLMFIGNLVVGRSTARQATRFAAARQSARSDTLTGVLNRDGLDKVASGKTMQQALKERRLGVIYLDLNNFKTLNDTVGHEAGDMALQITAERLRSAIRTNDVLARVGGDEFVIIIVDDNPIQAAEFVSDRIQARTQAPIIIGDDTHLIRPSIGIAIGDGSTAWDTLMSHADDAMYRAKRKNVFHPVFYRHVHIATARKTA